MRERKQTALITGASSGIGAEFARRLAAQGYELIIAARRIDRLNALAAELLREHDTKVTVVRADLAKPGAATMLASYIRASATPEIDVLINNSGFGHIGEFAEEDLQSMADEINVNITALTQLSRIYLPGMIARNRGTIINIASTASYQPLPNMAVYAATKHYVRAFTEALWGEVHGTNVKVLAVSPGPTETEFFEIAEGHALGNKLATVKQVVDVALKEVSESGMNRPSVVVGGKNGFLAFAARILPRSLVIKVSKKMLKSNLELLAKQGS